MQNVDSDQTLYYFSGMSVQILGVNTVPGPEVMKVFSCLTQLSMKFSLLINMKMPTIVGIFIFITRAIFMLSYV